MARNGDLLIERNKRIYERYKELYDIEFIRHDKVLELLSKEFYIQPESLQKIVVAVKRDVKNIVQVTIKESKNGSKADLN